MNAAKIYADEHYAYARKQRGLENAHHHAQRVRVISMRKVAPEAYYGGTNARTEVTIETEDGRRFETSARNLLDFWDSYKDERDAFLAEQERIKQERIERRQREEQERERKVAKQKIRDKMLDEAIKHRMGLTPFKVETDYFGNQRVVFLREELEVWLGLDAVPSYVNPEVNLESEESKSATS